MPKHYLLIKSESIGADMVGNRLVCRLVDKDANRLPEIVRLKITLFECPWLPVAALNEDGSRIFFMIKLPLFLGLTNGNNEKEWHKAKRKKIENKEKNRWRKERMEKRKNGEREENGARE